MSHKATNWLSDIDPKLLNNSEFRVLFVLCDCHNPSRGCFPRQDYLMDRTGRGSSSINDALSGLEKKNLIRRERRSDPKTNQRLPTHYILGFEFDEPQQPTPNNGDGSCGGGSGTEGEHSCDPTPNSGDGAISGFRAKPSPVLRQSQLRKSGVAYKDEPVREPVKEPCAAGAAHTGFDFEDFADRFRSAYPRPGDGEATSAELRAAIEGGVDPELILRGAKAYALEQKGNRRQYIAYPENWLRRRGWETQAVANAGPEANAEDVGTFYAKTIKEGKPWLCTHISADRARGLVSAGLVTVEECQKVGVL